MSTLAVGDRAATLGADGQWVRGVVEHLNGSLLLRVDHIGERPVTCEIREHFADGEWEDAVLPEAAIHRQEGGAGRVESGAGGGEGHGAPPVTGG